MPKKLPRLPKLPEWTKNHPLFPIFTSMVMMFTSGPLYDFLKDPNYHFKKYGYNNFPDIETWLSFYTTKNIELISSVRLTFI